MSAQYRHEELQRRRDQLSALLASLLHVGRSHPQHRRLLDRCLHQLDPVVHRFQDTRSSGVRDDLRRWTERLRIRNDEQAARELETAFAAFERCVQQRWQSQHEREAQYRIVALLLRLARLPSASQSQRQQAAGELQWRSEERAAEPAQAAARVREPVTSALDDDDDDDDDGWEAEFDRVSSDSEVDAEDTGAAAAADCGSSVVGQRDGQQAEHSRPLSSHRPSYLTALEEVWPYVVKDGEQDEQQRRSRQATGGEKKPLLLLQPAAVTLQRLLDPEGNSVLPLVSEQFVVCHLLLLCLQLPNALFAWDEQAAEYVTLQPLVVSHLSAASLAFITAAVVRHATNTRSLHTFVQSCCTATLRHSCSAHRLGCCLTAYLNSHERWLSQALAAVEATGLSLLALSEQLAASVKEVDALQSLTSRLSSPALSSSAALAPSSPPPALDTAQLLSELYSQYALCSLRDDRQLAALLLSLFLETLTPYLDALHTWTASGTLAGVREEDGFLVHLPHAAAQHKTDAGYEEEMAAGWEAQETAEGKPRKYVDGAACVPSFLAPLLSAIIATGNNQRIVRSIRSRAAQQPQPEQLSSVFRRSLLRFLPNNSSEQSPHSSLASSPPSPPSSAHSSLAPAVEPLAALDDCGLADDALPSGNRRFFTSVTATSSSFTPLLTSAGYQLLDAPSFVHVTAADIPPSSSPPSAPFPVAETDGSFYSAPAELPVLASSMEEGERSLASAVHRAMSSPAFRPPPALPLLQSCLLQPLHQRFLLSSRQLLETLLQDCALVSCLSALRDFYFSGNGLLVDELLSASCSPGISTVRLQERLNDSLAAASPACRRFLAHRMRVVRQDRASVSDASSLSSVHGSLLAGSSVAGAVLLSLSFQCELPWPLREIVTADQIRRYNAVLRFILLLRRSLQALSRMAVAAPGSSAAATHPLEHRFHLFRASVHHTVRVLHDHVLTHAACTAWPELEAAVMSTASPPSLSSLRRHHARYIDRVHSLCLLTPKLSAAFAAVERVLAVVGEVEEVSRLLQRDYLQLTIDDDWDAADDGSRRRSLLARTSETAEADASEGDEWLINDEEEELELATREARRRRRREWRRALSEEQQAALRLRYDGYKDRLYDDCVQRLDELQSAYRRDAAFLCLLCSRMANNSTHSHRTGTATTQQQQRLLGHLRRLLLCSPLAVLRSPCAAAAVSALAVTLDFNGCFARDTALS